MYASSRSPAARNLLVWCSLDRVFRSLRNVDITTPHHPGFGSQSLKDRFEQISVLELETRDSRNVRMRVAVLNRQISNLGLDEADRVWHPNQWYLTRDGCCRRPALLSIRES